MLQRFPIALAQVKAGNNSESLLNEIRQIVYSLYQSKQITKKYTTSQSNLFNKIPCNVWKTLYLWTLKALRHLSLMFWH